MKRFRRILKQAVAQRGTVVVLDPQDIAGDLVAEFFGEHDTVVDWFGLRKWWEWSGKNTNPANLVVLRIVESSVRTKNDVPPDILSTAHVVQIETELSDKLAAVLSDLPEDLASMLSESGARDEIAFLEIANYYGFENLAINRTSTQLKNASILRLREDVPEVIRDSIRKHITNPMAIELADGKPADLLQQEWERWVRGEDAGQYSGAIEELGPGIAPLFAYGILFPVASTRLLPPWARLGKSDDSASDIVKALLTRLPEEPPGELDAWLSTAENLGEVRWRIGSSNITSDLRSDAEQRSAELSEAFEIWIRAHYVDLLNRSFLYPASVSGINDFLRIRLSSGQAERIALLVLDGMGLSQWAQIKETMGLTPLESQPLMAVIPTVTSISRQAIFAGALPRHFPNSIGDTRGESELWSRFWTEIAGLGIHDVNYLHTQGTARVEELGFAHYRASGVAALVIDELGHSSTVYHDVQQILGIDQWIERGFLRGAIDEASKCAAELWVTSDHGNLMCQGIGPSNPGVLGERATTRVQIFDSEISRSAASAPGIDWNVKPTLPPEVLPRFAAKTDAYTTRGKKLLTHGGLSIHEVVVPLVRLT